MYSRSLLKGQDAARFPARAAPSQRASTLLERLALGVDPTADAASLAAAAPSLLLTPLKPILFDLAQADVDYTIDAIAQLPGATGAPRPIKSAGVGPRGSAIFGKGSGEKY